ncbi:MAG TPA: hypothetical protein VM715_18000 [Candidatus Acidoferrum sp.]|jgi:hypothetical protein|nr:hypothetical protein [Candidatus Acidoferrum sp.]
MRKTDWTPSNMPNRDEVIVCMVIAFCSGNAIISIIYRVMTE